MFCKKYFNIIVEYGTLLFVFLVPWQARLILSEGQINGGYWEYGTKSLYATEIILFVVLVAFVIPGAIYIHKTKPVFKKRRVFGHIGALIALIIWAFLSIFWSIDSSIAFERLIVLVEAIVVFLIISSGIISFKKLFWAIILSGLIQALFAITQFFLQWIPESSLIGMSSQYAQDLGVSVVETELRRWLRAYGSFPHPNILGSWLVLSLMLVIDRFCCHSELHAMSHDCRISESVPLSSRHSELVSESLHSKNKILKQVQDDAIFLPVAYIILLFGLLATFSRSAWIGFGIFLIIFVMRLFIYKAWAQAIKIVLITCLTVLCFYRIFPEPINTRLGFSVKENLPLTVSGFEGRLETKSNTEHISSISQGLEIIKQNPLKGVGIGNYGLAVYDQIDNSQEAWFYQPAHNVILLIFAELGIVGILIMAYGLWLMAFRGIFRKILLNAGVFFIPIIIIISFDHYLWSLYPGIMISAVYVGVLMLLIQKDKNFNG